LNVDSSDLEKSRTSGAKDKQKRKSKIKQLYKIVFNRFGGMCDERGTGDQVENFLVKRGINHYKANDLAAKFMDKMMEGKTSEFEKARTLGARDKQKRKLRNKIAEIERVADIHTDKGHDKQANDLYDKADRLKEKLVNLETK